MSSAIKASITYSVGHVNLLINDNIHVDVRHNLIPDRCVSVDRYIVLPCRTGSFSAANILELRILPERKTFGFVFPITSFRNEMEYNSLYGLRYADAAFRGFITEDNLNKFAVSDFEFSMSEDEIFPDAIFGDELSLMALSKKTLQENSITPPECDLMLRKNGIQILTDDLLSSPRITLDNVESALNFRKPSMQYEGDFDKLALLLKSADLDNSEIGKFIQYYQFFEYMLDKIFETAIPKIASDGVNPWVLKERLTQITGDRSRWTILEEHCLKNMTSRASQNALRHSCEIFLKSIEAEYNEDWNWHRKLYQVRNVIVHRQIQFLKPEYMPTLEDINLYLRNAALECLFHFDHSEADRSFRNISE